MEGAVWNEEKMLIDKGFSISDGNIFESSITNSSSSSYSPTGSENNNSLRVIINNVNSKNPAAFNKKSSLRSKNRRKNSETQTVKTTNLMDDGYDWRKYGQKIILNELHPKSYYRCTHHKDEQCQAKKWVQQESENPPIYKTTYLGNHNCKNPHKFPQILFPDYSPLSPPPAAENFSGTSSSPVLIRFNSPTSSHVFNINCTSSSPPSIPSSSSWNDCSMMLLEDQGGPEIDMWPSIASPSYSSESYDLDMMIQELLAYDNLDFMQDY